MLRFQVNNSKRSIFNDKLLSRFEPEIEPMFITLALYYFKERKKVCVRIKLCLK
jgi:hypothetical protein